MKSIFNLSIKKIFNYYFAVQRRGFSVKNDKLWNKVRNEFPASKNLVYLNTAGGAPISKHAASQAREFYDELVNTGDHWKEWLEKREQVRKKVAKFINADPDEIAFTLNTSHGMNLISQMLNNGSDEIVTMHDEFPSTTFPWLNRGYKALFVKPKNQIYTKEAIEKKIEKTTRILLTSHVQYSTGFKQDLVEIGKLCKKRGLVFIVNATQSFGAFPIDVKKAKIDFLAASGFKWIGGGYGIGILYINKKWFNKVHYPLVGWQSMEEVYPKDNRKLNIRKVASVLEVGCHPFANIFTLGGGIDIQNKIGKKRIEKRIYYLADYLADKLKENNFEIVSPLERKYRSGITIVKMENATKIVEKLKKKGIMVSARGEGLRVSVHFYNNEKDIDTFIEELKKIA